MSKNKILIAISFFLLVIIFSFLSEAKEKMAIAPIIDDKLFFIINNISNISYLIIANVTWLLFVVSKSIVTYFWNKNEKLNDKTQEKLDWLIENVRELKINQANFLERKEASALIREEIEYRESFKS